jgi:hypothetical protein
LGQGEWSRSVLRGEKLLALMAKDKNKIKKEGFLFCKNFIDPKKGNDTHTIYFFYTINFYVKDMSV